MDNLTINRAPRAGAGSVCAIVDKVDNVDKFLKTYTSRRMISTKKIVLRDGDKCG